MRVCVVGLGYIGLPTSVVLAQHGHEVIGIDKNPAVVESLNAGVVHLEEPGVQEILQETIKNGHFKASLTPENADAFIISVPTPNLDDDLKGCDLSYVIQAVRTVIPFLQKGNLVIIESTIAPRSTDDTIMPIFEETGFSIGTDLYLAHCPERVLPGNILKELVENNRIIGGITPACAEAASQIYRSFVKGEIFLTEAKTAEMSKCMENTFRDVNIALANELAKICNKLEINSLEVIRLANKHPRVNLHQPGPGVGGHCLAVDPYFVYASTPDTAKIIKLARDVNESMPHYVVDQVKHLLKGIEQPKIAVFGVTYKGNTDDVRESPALKIVNELNDIYANVSIYDPHVRNIDYVSLDDAVQNAHLVVVLSDHNEFKHLDMAFIADKMARPLIFDTKNCVTVTEGSPLTVLNYGSLYKWA